MEDGRDIEKASIKPESESEPGSKVFRPTGAKARIALAVANAALIFGIGVPSDEEIRRRVDERERLNKPVSRIIKPPEYGELSEMPSDLKAPKE